MGVFSFQHPWALRTQAFIVEGLSHEMDFKRRYGMRSTLEAPLPSFRFWTNRRTLDEGECRDFFSSSAFRKGGPILCRGSERHRFGSRRGSLADRAVKSIETGRVLEVKEHPENGITILIQHTGERTAIYSRLAETGLKVNDWVQGGDIVGTLASSGAGARPPFISN